MYIHLCVVSVGCSSCTHIFCVHSSVPKAEKKASSGEGAGDEDVMKVEAEKGGEMSQVEEGQLEATAEAQNQENKNENVAAEIMGKSAQPGSHAGEGEWSISLLPHLYISATITPCPLPKI